MTGLIILIDTCWSWLEDQLTLPISLNSNIFTVLSYRIEAVVSSMVYHNYW
jgi:hypothetical protein